MLAHLVALLAGSTLSTSTLSADPGDACVTSYESAQQARKQGQLVRAKANLRLCSAACPAALGADCDRWLGEVEGSLAHLVIAARDSEGRKVAVRLTIDGVERGVDEAIDLDPGKHQVTITARGYAPIEEMVELRAGAPVKKSWVMALLLEPPSEPQSGGSVLGPILLGSGGLLTLVAAGALALIGHLDVSEMRDTCAPRCERSRVDQVGTYWTTGGVLAGVGGAALVASGVWLGVVVSPSASKTDGKATGADLGLTLRFAF